MVNLPQILSQAEHLLKQRNLAYWALATTGRKRAKEKYIRLNNEWDGLFGNVEVFRAIKRVQSSAENPVEQRKWDVLRRISLASQGHPALREEENRLSAELEHTFDTFRPKVQGKYVNWNDISRILRTSLDSHLRKEAWEAGKEIGFLLAENLRQLVRIRNSLARSLGFSDYYRMALELQEIPPSFLQRFLQQMDEGSKPLFHAYHNALREELKKKFRLEAVQPWHYADLFFQEPPEKEEFLLNHLFRNVDMVEVTRKTYEGMGMDIRELLTNSDLYEREGKNPHGFCLDVDRKGDIRVLCNIRNDARWMKTLLHEFGHAVYHLYYHPKHSFWLRTPAHIFTTEAVALLMDRLVIHPVWLKTYVKIPSAQANKISRESRQRLKERFLIFTRWALVMSHFERKLYESEDIDLNRTWWELVEKYQEIPAPDGRSQKNDWACKIHLSIAPVYYHNYLMGEAWAMQLERKIERLGEKVSKTAGEFLIQQVFHPANSFPWDEFVQVSLSEPFSAQPFLDFLRS